MNQEIAEFWEDARSELHSLCGQDSGRRDRRKAHLRDQLAKEFGLNSRTLKGFLNMHQKTLGRGALFGLFARIPALEARYKQATKPQIVPQASIDENTGTPDFDHQNYVQLTLQFDGFDIHRESASVSLPPGREGTLTIRIGPRRMA